MKFSFSSSAHDIRVLRDEFGLHITPEPMDAMRIIYSGAGGSLTGRGCCAVSMEIRKNAHRIGLTRWFNHGRATGVFKCSAKCCNLLIYNGLLS